MKFSTPAKTVQEYLDLLPEERRTVVAKVRQVAKKAMPKGYKEGINWGAIVYEIPLSRFPDTYNKQPLCYLAIAAEKNHYALYMMGVYGDSKQAKMLKDAYARTGKKLDMGKACVRFKSIDDLPLDTISELIAAIPPEKYIETYEKSRRKR